MNRFHLTGTAAIGALFLSASAFAADVAQPVTGPQWDAYVAAGGGYTSFENSISFPDGDDGFAGVPILGNDMDGFAGDVRSSAAYQLTNGFGIQGDVVFNYQDMNVNSSGDFSTESTDVAEHIFYRNDNMLVGVFGQIGGTEYGSLATDIDRFYAGNEAQAFWGAFTLYGRAGWQMQDWADFDDADIDGFFISAEARYFATDNLKLSLKGGYDTLDWDGLFDIDTIHAGGSGEYRFVGSPFSTFLSLDVSKSEVEITDFEQSEVRVLAGIKLNLGTDTLIQRDRAGASLDPVKPLAFGYISPR
jgi:hypothetical protein